MRYKYIPAPELAEGQEMVSKYRLDSDAFVVGWEVGTYVEGEWNKLYDVMTLTPEQEEEWRRQQGLLPPNVDARMDSLEQNVSDLVNGTTERG